MKTLGEKLLSARKKQNLTQEQLALRINVSRSTISNWETNRSLPDYNSIRLLSQVLLCNFLGYNDENAVQLHANTQQMHAVFLQPPVIDVIMPENACNFTPNAIDLRINGSDCKGNAVHIHVTAEFRLER